MKIFRDEVIRASEGYSQERSYEAEAAQFCNAIAVLGSNEGALENLESYLSQHFGEWLKRYANSPMGIAEELSEFANVY